jgi:hypothetical protein
MTASPLKRWARWLRALAWAGAWTAIVASSAFLPLWASIALAVGVFAAQMLLPHQAAACHAPGRATSTASPDR